MLSCATSNSGLTIRRSPNPSEFKYSSASMFCTAYHGNVKFERHSAIRMQVCQRPRNGHCGRPMRVVVELTPLARALRGTAWHVMIIAPAVKQSSLKSNTSSCSCEILPTANQLPPQPA